MVVKFCDVINMLQLLTVCTAKIFYLLMHVQLPFITVYFAEIKTYIKYIKAILKIIIIFNRRGNSTT